jgi:hypothetical protein
MTAPNPGTLDDAALIRWTNTLPTFGQEIFNHARYLKRQALLAAQKYPADTAYIESLNRAAALAWQAAVVFAQVAPTIKVTNLIDWLRNIEAPRHGSLRAEAAADNTAAQHDRDNWQK